MQDNKFFVGVTPRSPNPTMHPSLSISGGGFMGRGPALFCARLESETGISLSSSLAWGAGTSVGAINIALLAAGHPAQAVLDLHREHLGKIFGERLWAYRLTKCGPQYGSSYLEDLLKRFLGSRTLGQTAFPVYIAAWDARRRQIKVFGPKDDRTPLWYAVRCSMAAPTYFAPVDGRYTDGGVAANDPALIGYAGAVYDGVVKPGDDVRILDLVTSGTTPEGAPIPSDRFALTTLQREILPSLTAGNSSDVGFMLRSLATASPGLFHSLQVAPETPDWDLDQIQHAPDLDPIWQRAWDEHGGPAKVLLYGDTP